MVPQPGHRGGNASAHPALRQQAGAPAVVAQDAVHAPPAGVPAVHRVERGCQVVAGQERLRAGRDLVRRCQGRQRLALGGGDVQLRRRLLRQPPARERCAGGKGPRLALQLGRHLQAQAGGLEALASYQELQRAGGLSASWLSDRRAGSLAARAAGTHAGCPGCAALAAHQRLGVERLCADGRAHKVHQLRQARLSSLHAAAWACLLTQCAVHHGAPTCWAHLVPGHLCGGAADRSPLPTSGIPCPLLRPPGGPAAGGALLEQQLPDRAAARLPQQARRVVLPQAAGRLCWSGCSSGSVLDLVCACSRCQRRLPAAWARCRGAAGVCKPRERCCALHSAPGRPSWPGLERGCCTLVPGLQRLLWHAGAGCCWRMCDLLGGGLRRCGLGRGSAAAGEPGQRLGLLQALAGRLHRHRRPQ